MLLAAGRVKAPALRRLLHGPADPEWPVTALRLHPDVTVVVDRATAALLDGDDGYSASPSPSSTP